MSFSAKDPTAHDRSAWCQLPTALITSNLPHSAAILYASISSLVRECGYCYASNSYLARHINLDPRTVQRLLSMLQKKKLIKVEVTRENWGEQRKIYLDGSVPRFLQGGGDDTTPGGKKRKRLRHNQKQTKGMTPVSGGYDTGVTPGTTLVSPPLYKDDIDKYRIESVAIPAKPVTPKRKASPQIKYNWENMQFEGITEEHYRQWQEAFPKVNVREFIKQVQVIVQGRRARDGHRRCWLKSLTAQWLPREQERLNSPPRSASPLSLKPWAQQFHGLKNEYYEIVVSERGICFSSLGAHRSHEVEWAMGKERLELEVKRRGFE